jgi:hypothetical protein
VKHKVRRIAHLNGGQKLKLARLDAKIARRRAGRNRELDLVIAYAKRKGPGRRYE